MSGESVQVLPAQGVNAEADQAVAMGNFIEFSRKLCCIGRIGCRLHQVDDLVQLGFELVEVLSSEVAFYRVLDEQAEAEQYGRRYQGKEQGQTKR